LPIVLCEVNTDEEMILSDTSIAMASINPGIYLAFLQYDTEKYQPLMDLQLIPGELLPEKDLLPKSMPFLIDRIQPFAKLFTNIIDYMKEYEQPRVTHQPPKANSPRNSQQTPFSMVSSDSLHTSLSTISMPVDLKVDIRKYFVTDPERLSRTSENVRSLPFTLQILTDKKQLIANNEQMTNISHLDNSLFQFDENELILFKHRLISLNLDPILTLDLKNCVHQLALEQQLDTIEVCAVLMKLNHMLVHNELHSQHIPKWIQNLQKAASISKSAPLSNLMKTLFRIDHLEKFNKLDKQTVRLFNQRINHLAQLGVLNQPSKILIRLCQLDLFENEPNSDAFSNFICNDLQRCVPKKIPLNTLGINEIIHHLQMNKDRLGITTTLILIDNLQQFVHTGILLMLHKLPQFKQYLLQFVHQIQTGRFIGVYLQRLIDQMNHNIRMNSVKKTFLTNQLNSLSQKVMLESKTKENFDKLISASMNAALHGQLNTFVRTVLERSPREYVDMNDNNGLQSLLVFIHEQSSTGHLPNQYLCDFIQHLRHFAQLGILYTPEIDYILTDLHKAKDHDSITVRSIKTKLDQMKTVSYVYTYDHLDLAELNDFLNQMIVEENLTHGQVWYVLDRLVNLCQLEPITSFDIKTLLTNLRLEYNRQQAIYPKLIENFQTLVSSHSSSFAELYSLERDIQRVLFSSNSNTKRIPDEVRRRFNEIMVFCTQISVDRLLVEELYGPTMNYKFYNQVKEILKTGNIINKKQSLTAIVQIHKHFLRISRLHTRNYLLDQQLDTILENIQTWYPEKQDYFEDLLKHMAELGCLQVKPSSIFSALMNKIHVQLNHPDVEHIAKHLSKLEQEDKLDSGTYIEIQNRLNQIARFHRWTCPRMKSITDDILKYQGKRYLSDRNGYQSIQFYRLILNDITHAIEFEFYVQKLAAEHRISDMLCSHWRQFVHQILQNELNIDELTKCHVQLNALHHVKRMDIDQVESFISKLSQDSALSAINSVY
ncbi:unnamed protein product, partial [Adineta ricciae]